MICSICANDIEDDGFGYDEGHNAEPLVKNGRCCDDCNRDIVIPSRLMGAPDFISILKKERLHPDFANGFIQMFKRRKVKLHEREIPTAHEAMKLQAAEEYNGVKEKWAGFLPEGE